MRGVTAGALCLVAAALFVLQPVLDRLDTIRSPQWARERMTWVVRAAKVNGAFGGFEQTYAAFLWIRTTLYVGDHFQTDRDFRWLVSMLDAITRLNPHFVPPYESAALLIPEFSGDPGAARVILERGMCSQAAQHWRVPFYLGWIYYNEYRDLERAAHFISIAATRAGAPVLLARLAASLKSAQGSRAQALAFLEMLGAQTQDPVARGIIISKMRRLEKL